MTLKSIIKSKYDELTNGMPWIIIYKINNSWNCAVFYHTDGCYENGLIFDDEDMTEIHKIAKTDPKAICINGVINGFSNDFTLNELEDKIRTMYELRHYQLNGDFLGSIVPSLTSQI